MLKKILLFLLFFSSLISAQLKVKFNDINFIDDDNWFFSVSIEVFVQNYGATTYINNITAGMISNSRYQGFSTSYYEKIADFALYWLRTDNNDLQNAYPSSVTIKTIYGNYIPMDSPEYEFESTGNKSGQLWNILYTNIPKQLFGKDGKYETIKNVRAKILGTIYELTTIDNKLEELIKNKSN